MTKRKTLQEEIENVVRRLFPTKETALRASGGYYADDQLNRKRILAAIRRIFAKHRKGKR